jgi:NAD(P)H-nitrite reductase large subunit
MKAVLNKKIAVNPPIITDEAISRRTGALSGCGGCEWEIADMLKAFAEEKAGH